MRQSDMRICFYENQRSGKNRLMSGLFDSTTFTPNFQNDIYNNYNNI